MTQQSFFRASRLTSTLLAFTLALTSVEHISAQAQELPVEDIIETEATDVEVCQDFICTKLREEILEEAAKCRPLASFKRKRMRVRRKTAKNSCKIFNEDNFKFSKGKCSAAIRSACERSGVDGKYLAVNAYDLHKKGLMERAGFVNMIWKYDEATAPLGSILIYVGGAGHRYGHVEVRVNPNLFCSDHCTPKPVTSEGRATKDRYRLVGVYLPFASSIQISSNINGRAGLSPGLERSPASNSPSPAL